MTTAIGPFTPTTPTVLLDCVNNTLTGPQSLTALKSDGWPSTFLCTNVGAGATYFNIATLEWLSTQDPTTGPFLMPGQSMVFEVNAPGVAQITGNALVAFSFGIGNTNVAVTGGLNK